MSSAHDDDEQGIGALVGEIVADAQLLVKQHLELFRHELREDVRRSRRAVIALTIAHLLATVGCVAMCAMLVGLGVWLLPGLPWWCWAGIVGAMMLVAGWAVLVKARKLLEGLTLMPTEAARVIKEDIHA